MGWELVGVLVGPVPNGMKFFPLISSHPEPLLNPFPEVACAALLHVPIL